MRIGINLQYLRPGIVGGTETHAAGLLSGLAAEGQGDEFVVFVNQDAAEWPLPDAANFSRVVCNVGAASPASRYWFEQAQLPGLVKRHGIDVVHSPGYVSPLLVRCPAVVTVHDLNFRAFGSRMPLTRRMALQFFVGQSVRRAARVLTVSEFARQEILAAYRVPEDLVVVTHNAPERQATPGSPTGIRGGAGSTDEPRIPYIIGFSSTTPNKNIPRLLDAFARARAEFELPHQLVLVGHPPPEFGSGASAAAVPSDGVEFTGYISDSELWKVLAGAQMLVFPSVYEGFGLPVLEAMAAGVPVVCSNRASLPEVAGDAALFFDPFSTEEMAHQMARVARDADLRSSLVERGSINVRRFSWRQTARRTLEVYRAVFAEAKARRGG